MAKEIVLVTGAGQGIGLEVCRQLSTGGKTVILTARSLEKASAAAGKLATEGLGVIPKALDVNNEQSLQALASWCESEFGHLDVLVNNAAGYSDWSETPVSADLSSARSVMETNLFAPWRMAQVFLPLLRKSGHGRIVNVSSGAGSYGDPQFGLTTGFSVSYAVSKAALTAFTVKLAGALKDEAILVNAVCPGFTATQEGLAEMGARPIELGAASVVWAAVLPKGGPTGGFFRDGNPLPW